MSKHGHLVEVQLAVTPSRFMHPNFPDWLVDYRRIVGVSSPAGSLACGFPIATPRTTEVMRMTPAFAERLHGFFGTWMVDRDPEAGGSLWEPSSNYLCHSFSRAMGGRKHLHASVARHEMREEKSRMIPFADENAALPFGTQVAVLNQRDNEEQEDYELLHSSVAVGLDSSGRPNFDDPTMHMQVFERGGNLGLAPLAETVRYYDSLGDSPLLNVVPPPTLITRAFELLP